MGYIEEIKKIKNKFDFEIPIAEIANDSLKELKRAEIQTIEKVDGMLIRIPYACRRKKLEIFNSRITEMSFRESNIKLLVFVNCEISDVSIHDCIFKGALFLNCIIRKVFFDKCNLDEAKFIDCKLSNIKCKNGSFNDAWFIDTNYDEIEFGGKGSAYYTEIDNLIVENTSMSSREPKINDDINIINYEKINKKDNKTDILEENIMEKLTKTTEMDNQLSIEIKKGIFFKKKFNSLSDSFDFTGKTFDVCTFNGIDFYLPIDAGTVFHSCTFIDCKFSYSFKSLVMKECTFKNTLFCGEKIGHILFDNCHFESIPVEQKTAPKMTDCEFKNCTENGDRIILMLEYCEDSFTTDYPLNSIDIIEHKKALEEAKLQVQKEIAVETEQLKDKNMTLQKTIDENRLSEVNMEESVKNIATSLIQLSSNLGNMLEDISSKMVTKEITKEVEIVREPVENELKELAIRYYSQLSAEEKFRFSSQIAEFQPSVLDEKVENLSGSVVEKSFVAEDEGEEI